MSGGTYQYYQLWELSQALEGRLTNPYRAALGALLRKLSDTMEIVDKVDSGDCALGDENSAIEELFQLLKADHITILKAQAYDSLKSQLLEYFEDKL